MADMKEIEEGYPIDVFLCDISDVICSACFGVVRNAVEPIPAEATDECNHVFCEGCLIRSLAEDRRCPECRIAVQPPPSCGYKPNPEARAQVLQMCVVCAAKNGGCNWRGTVAEFDAHIKTECEFCTVTCPLCQKEVVAKQSKTHRETECPSRVVACAVCHASFKASEEQEHKEKECVGSKVKCEQCGMADIPRNMLPQHEDKECDCAVVPCVVGACAYRGPRNKMSDHLLGALTEHFALLSARCEQAERRAEAAEKKCEELATQLAAAKH